MTIDISGCGIRHLCVPTGRSITRLMIDTRLGVIDILRDSEYESMYLEPGKLTVSVEPNP